MCTQHPEWTRGAGKNKIPVGLQFFKAAVQELKTMIMILEDDHFHDECGVMGVQHHPEAARLAYLGLYALQHRGQESAGIVASDGNAARSPCRHGTCRRYF